MNRHFDCIHAPIITYIFAAAILSTPRLTSSVSFGFTSLTPQSPPDYRASILLHMPRTARCRYMRSLHYITTGAFGFSISCSSLLSFSA